MSLPSSLALSLWDPSTKSETPPTATDCAVNFKEWYLDDENRLNTFAPYIGILPTPSEVELDVTPDYYSENEIKMLEFPKIIESINQRNRDIEKSSTTTKLSPSDLKYYTYLVTSRSFNIRLSADDKDSDNVKGVRIMLPFLDLLNHGGKSNAELDILNPEKDDSTFVIRAKRPIQPGKEISLTYGSGGFSSVDLFSSYGFVPSGVEGRDEKNVKVGGRKRRPVTADERTMAKLETEEGYVSPWSTTLEEDVERIKEGAEGRERKILEFRAKMKVAGGWPVGVMDGKMDLKKKEGGGK
ncbi:hypothetical protein TL16_g13227 [Triparma laevis f. inornata]|nr:hypothetical protein TL16_g13227 [Triparma laevis f. inornata]